MSKEIYNEPRLAINRVYTRRGDSGETGLVGGQRVSKNSPRIEAYGTVDELNAFAGGAGRGHSLPKPAQRCLFRVGPLGMPPFRRRRNTLAAESAGQRGIRMIDNVEVREMSMQKSSARPMAVGLLILGALIRVTQHWN